MSERLPLSVAIVVKNEERWLPGCLESVRFAEDIVVVDSGSADSTVQIAEAFGCRVFAEEWKGFGPQKNSAVDKCLHDWVLNLDADERIPETTRQTIERILAAPDADAYRFPRKNHLGGKWIPHSDWWPDPQVRLFDRRRGRFRFTVHASWQTGGTLKAADAPIDHYSYDNYAHMLRKLDDYSTQTARELFESGKRAGPLSPLKHGLGMFFKIYLLKQGFRDGLDGLVISVIKAGGSFFKYAKLLEMQRNNEGGSTGR
ncbi:MAG: glycosyltransferase family 2 protein [Armatimonadetes bacterium]|nr:glycosyltransferase family 2 protein [Armatimonadota bacterium]